MRPFAELRRSRRSAFALLLRPRCCCACCFRPASAPSAPPER